MQITRKIRKITKSQATVEGAGVRLKRAFGFREVPMFDPFLLLDDFRSQVESDYIRGFPWHPHRGIETITYVIDGRVEHGDSLGNTGVISAGDVQWMTAGSGIIHQEMPKGDAGQKMGGFQLWANLPASQKMTPPSYREVTKNQIPRVEQENGTVVRVVCGVFEGRKGPVADIFIEPEYLDVTVPARSEFVHVTKRGHTVFAYVIDGRGTFGSDSKSFGSDGGGTAESVADQALVRFEDGDRIVATTAESDIRFLLISGAPLKEPVAWQGPIVMNTEAELRTAFEEYRQGTFIKEPI